MSEKSSNFKTDWAKFDAHVITPDEYEEMPELTEANLAEATPHIGGREVSWPEFKTVAAAQLKRGRPKSDNNKVLLSLRYSPEVVDFFRSTGDGWQTRMDEALKQWVKDHAA